MSALNAPVAAVEGANLIEALRLAEEKLNDATRKKRFVDQEIDEAETALRNGTDKINSQLRAGFTGVYTPHVQMQVDAVRGRAATAKRQLPAAEKALKEAQKEIEGIRKQIATHPALIAARGEHRKLVDLGISIAIDSWKAPLLEIRDFVKRFDEVSSREISFVREANHNLRALGLPDLHLQLHVRRHALPLFVLESGIESRAQDAVKAIESVTNSL
jgi:hypothetical protein